MRRALLPLLAVLAFLPVVAAAPNPEVGYIPGEDETDIASGQTATYDVTILVAPPDGKTRVDAEFGYEAVPGAIAPPTRLQLRRSNAGEFEDLGVLQGTTQRIVKPLTITEPRGFEYVLRVEATLPEDQLPGDHTSRLLMLGRDPTTQSSSPGIIYEYTFHVLNTPPVASFTYTKDFLTVAFDASASSDPHGEALAYSWAFGDGTQAGGATPSHTFATAGSYAVTLTVTDPHGGSAQQVQSVTVVANRAPTAAFQYTVQGQNVTFDPTLSTDPEGAALVYAWEFGDGQSSTQARPTHEYAAEGTFTVRLTATDPKGLSDQHTEAVAVNGINHAPDARFTVATRGLTATFTNQGHDPDGDAITYRWDFGDGQTSNQVHPVHTYATAGSYRVTLRATDLDGAFDEAIRNVAVTPITDADGDGFSDETETAAGSDPNNAASKPTDRDGDGRLNDNDNCPAAPNANQADRDADGIGDACDPTDDGGGADPDGDGVPSARDNCPGAANADQLDRDGDRRGDACDSDRDNDGAVNELDDFPLDAAETADTDEDGVGDKKDADDDGDGLDDAQETSAGSDPLDRQDPPFRAVSIVALRLANGTNLVAWAASGDQRVEEYLVWREASPLVLLFSQKDDGKGFFRFFDPSPPARARYHVQAQLVSDAGLLYAAPDSRVSNWVGVDGATLEECAGKPDTDSDGLCDELELQLGLDPARKDSDGDGRSDGDEVTGDVLSVPFRVDSDGDGVNDGREATSGSDPLDGASTKANAGIDWSTVAMVGLAAAVVVLAALLFLRRKP